MPWYTMGVRRKGGASSASKKPVLSAGMKKAVDAEIKKITAPAEEIKYVAKSWPTQTIRPTLSTAAGANLYPMLPEVSNGTDASQRIGNALVPKGIRTHFAMYFPNATLMTTNIFVRLLCVSSREVKSYDATPSLAGDNLFLDGSGGSQDIPSGTNYSDNLSKNQFLPVNKKSWIVHHDKIIHFARNYGFTNNDTTSPRCVTGTVPLYHRFTLDTPHKAALKYDMAADTKANNFAPYWCAYAWTADGGNTTTDVVVDTRSDLYFVG